MLINNRSGHFNDQTSQRFPQIEICVNDIAVFDIDLDGDLDIFFAASDATTQLMSADRLILNDGTGHFSDISSTHLVQLPTISQNVDWGFINNDLYPDLLICGFASISPPFETSLYILLNDSTGHFSNHSDIYLPETAYGVLDAALVDVNGDSLNDIILANLATIICDEIICFDPIFTFSGQNAIYIQDTNNQFIDETQNRLPPNSNGSKLIKITDINNDGASELCFINIGFPGVSTELLELYLNDGNGFFESVAASRMPFQILNFLNDIEFQDFG